MSRGAGDVRTQSLTAAHGAPVVGDTPVADVRPAAPLTATRDAPVGGQAVLEGVMPAKERHPTRSATSPSARSRSPPGHDDGGSTGSR